MRVNTLHVDGQEFVLEPDQDVQSLQDDILTAARDGAGFVRFSTIGRATISVLITARVGVRFESIERDREVIAEWEAHPPSIDKNRAYDDVL